MNLIKKIFTFRSSRTKAVVIADVDLPEVNIEISKDEIIDTIKNKITNEIENQISYNFNYDDIGIEGKVQEMTLEFLKTYNPKDDFEKILKDKIAARFKFTIDSLTNDQDNGSHRW